MPEKIYYNDKNELVVPDNPYIPFIEGDGIGPDITAAMKIVIDGAIAKTYNGTKKIEWLEIFAGEKAKTKFDTFLPEETIQAAKDYIVSIKGPLSTPVGGGMRSLNVTLRQRLDLFACVRPVRYFEGVPAPVKHPEKLNVLIYRENTEDLYAGIEWEAGTFEAKKVIAFINDNFNKSILIESGIGIKPMSEFATRRLMRMALKATIRLGRKSVTIVHKGNIMKYTEGAFAKWAYLEAEENFKNETIKEKDITSGMDLKGKIIIKDRIADAMFQQILLRPDEYDILVTPNLNGDYLSDAAAAQVGGLGMAPGANIGKYAMFEATHGTAPKYAGLDKINPGSLILSAVMMLEFLGWTEAAVKITAAIQKTIAQKTVTYDLARQMEGATEIKCSEFAKKIVENL